MTPIEAFGLLQERCIREIAQGRRVEELASWELAEILRLHGCRIPRFEGDGCAVTASFYDWLDTEQGEAEIARFWK